ncbi:MAG: diguanylate cyclase, partial [Pseudomonadota bacterium]
MNLSPSANERSVEAAIRLRRRRFLSGTIVSVLVAILGYTIILRTSEFNRRSFEHIIAIENAREAAKELRAPDPDISGLVGHLTRAHDQALWCAEALTRVEALLMDLAGTQEIATICNEDLVAARRGLEMAAAHEEGRMGAVDFQNAILLTLDHMMQTSSRLAPHVAKLERTYLTAVAAVTVLLGLVLATFIWLGTRTALEMWREILRERSRFDAAISAMDDGFALFGPDNRLVACNGAYRSLAILGLPAPKIGEHREEIFRKSLEMGTAGAGDVEALDQRVTDYFARLDTGRAIEIDLDDGRHLRVRQWVSRFGDKVVVRTEQTALIRQQRLQESYARALEAAKTELERQAREDTLTGLPNRRAFEEALAIRNVAQPLPDGGQPPETVLIRVDLDHFKYVNDVLGHAAGDAVLEHVGKLLQRSLRSGDLAARIGGDEFVLLLAAGSTTEGAETLLGRLRESLRDPVIYEGKACRFGASFGIASSRSGARDGEELLAFADTALYEAKDRGRGRVEVYTPRIHDRVLTNRRLADELRSALDQGEFEPFFQPQVDAVTMEITGVEVLARWRPSSGAEIRTPATFLDLAGQLRLTGEIDAQIFERARAVVPDLQSLGLCPPQLSFNVSSQRMHDPSLVSAARALRALGPRVAFELLESISIEEESQVFAYHVDALKEAGIGIEIDDF